MSTLAKLKKARALEKENKSLKEQVELLESKVSYLRLEILQRATAFVNEQQIIFGLVDHLFDEDFTRTKGEAQRRWEFFKKAVNETDGDKDRLFEMLEIEVEVTPEKNQKMVMDLWESDRANNPEPTRQAK